MEDEEERDMLLKRAYRTAARAVRGGGATATLVWVSLMHRADLQWLETICESSERGEELPEGADVQAPDWERGVTSRDVREAVHRVHSGPAAVLLAELRARTDWDEIRTAGYVLRSGTGGPVPAAVSFPGRPPPELCPGGRRSRRKKLSATSNELLWATAADLEFNGDADAAEVPTDGRGVDEHLVKIENEAATENGGNRKSEGFVSQRGSASDKRDKRSRSATGNSHTAGSHRKAARTADTLHSGKGKAAREFARPLTAKEIQILKGGIRRWEEREDWRQPPTDAVQLIPARRPNETTAAAWRATSCGCRSARTMLSCRTCNEALRHCFRMPAEYPDKVFFVGCGSCKWRGPCGGGNCCKTLVPETPEASTPVLSPKESMAAAALLDAVAAAAAGEDSDNSRDKEADSMLREQSNGAAPESRALFVAVKEEPRTATLLHPKPFANSKSSNGIVAGMRPNDCES